MSRRVGRVRTDPVLPVHSAAEKGLDHGGPRPGAIWCTLGEICRTLGGIWCTVGAWDDRVMPPKSVDPAEMRAAVLAVGPWLRGETDELPARPMLALAVRTTARTLAQIAPGSSVEVRVPPFVAVQCIEGPRHTRGTPPNVVETDARTWLRLAAGLADLADEIAAATVSASGSRAPEVGAHLPLVRV